MASKKVKAGKASGQGKSGAMTRRGDAYEEEISGAELERLLNAVGEMSFDEAAALADQDGAPKIAGIQVVQKEQLEDVPFLVVHTKYREGDMGEYVSVTCKLQSGEIVVFNDGSSGVCAQLRGVAIRPDLPMRVLGGLRVSRYMFTDAQGKEKPAATWYLNPSPSKRLGANGIPAPKLGSAGARRETRIPKGTEEID